MATFTAKLDRQQLRYFELVKAFPLRPLRSDRELDRAVEVIDDLLDRPTLQAAERDYLEVLSGLVEQYEEKHHPIAPVSDADLLAHLIEARDTTQAQVAQQTKIAESTISAVLRGGRQLTRQHIARLANYFQVDPGVFDLQGLRD